MGRTSCLMLILLVGLAPAACGRSGKDSGKPRLPRQVDGPAGDAPDRGGGWSFLGKPDPKLVAEQALHLTPSVALGNLADDDEDLELRRGEAVKAWVERMAGYAARGSAGVVRVVFTHCVGWGSQVPSEYTLFGCFTPMAVFVHAAGTPEFVKRCNACSREDESCVEKWCSPRLVEGYFTGKKKEERQDPEDPDSARHSWELVVLRDRPVTGTPAESTELDPAMELVLPAGSPAPAGDPVTDGPRFAVAASVDRVWAPTSRSLADGLAARLRQEGHDPIVIDSRLVRTQWCCAHLVIAARAATVAEAERIRAALAAKNLGKFEVIELY